VVPLRLRAIRFDLQNAEWLPEGRTVQLVDRIRWVTNIAPPYRGALWAEVDSLRPLEVVTLAKSEPNRSWGATGADRFASRVLAWPRIKLQTRKSVYYFYSRGLLGGVRSGSVVILPGWENPASWLLMIAARVAGVPHFAFVESTEQTSGRGTQIFGRAKARFFRSATGCVAVGTSSVKGLLAVGVTSDRIVLCVNSIDGVALWSATSRLRNTLVPADGHVFLYCGQLIGRKRPDLVIRGFAAARVKGDVLLIVGAGPQEMPLRKLVGALGLAGAVLFLGYVPDEKMPEVWAQAHTLVMPSQVEVWGFVASEALAAGLNVIASNRAGAYSDIASEVGVYGVQPDLASVTAAMAKSSADWTGWTFRQTQMERSPRSSAESLVSGIDRVVGLGAKQRGRMHQAEPPPSSAV
jgi:glycosyltransferase involved in cell wall biosynthesis